MSEDQFQQLIERQVASEVHIENLTEAVNTQIKENRQEHQAIISVLDRQVLWRRRIQWTASTVLLLTGMMVGLFIHYAEWLWNILPMHYHTH